MELSVWTGFISRAELFARTNHLSTFMIQLLKENKRIINIDESWIAEIDYSRKMWCPSKAPCTVSEKSIGIRHSFIVALDTDGHVYYALTHANTDSDVMLSFIRRLEIVLNN